MYERGVHGLTKTCENNSHKTPSALFFALINRLFRNMSSAEGLDMLLHQCDKIMLVRVVKNICAMFQERYLDEDVMLDVVSQDVKAVVREALLQKKMAEQRQQDKDRNSFTVVSGAGVAAGERDGQLVSAAGGRERASTGLLVVGGDVLSFISTFLSWEQVKLQREWKAPGVRGVPSCHISPCSSMLLTCSGFDLHLWDAASGLLKNTLSGHTHFVQSCRFFPGEKTAVSASQDKDLKVWDVESGSLVRTLVGHTHCVTCVDVSPDNARILSCSLDRTWRVWNSRTGELQHTQHMIVHPDGHIYDSHCCSFSPNRRLLIVGCGTNLMLHDSTTYRLQLTFTGHGNLVSSCSFIPDGSTVLSGSHDCTMKLWSTTTGQCLRTLDGYSGSVLSCSFSPGGQDIISLSHDGALILWATATGQLRRIIDDGRTAGARITLSTCASSDGKYIASGHSKGIVKVRCWSEHL
jgi:WD40 repeat protein